MQDRSRIVSSADDGLIRENNRDRRNDHARQKHREGRSTGISVAILVTDGFEQVELEEPDRAVGEFSHGAGGGNRTHGLGIMRTVPCYAGF